MPRQAEPQVFRCWLSFAAAGEDYASQSDRRVGPDFQAAPLPGGRYFTGELGASLLANGPPAHHQRCAAFCNRFPSPGGEKKNG